MPEAAKMQAATLQQFPLVSCDGLPALEAAVNQLFGSGRFDAPRESRTASFKSVLNCRSLQHGALLFASYGAAVNAKIGPFDSYLQGFPICGFAEHTIGGTRVAVSESQASGAIISPGESADLHYKTRFDHLVLVLQPAPLLKKLEALAGLAPVGPLIFAKRASDHPEAFALKRLVLFLAEQLSAPTTPSPLVLAELEQAVMVAFLTSNASNFSAMLNGDPRSSGPWQVRRAEEYLAAHWDQPITIEALAMATGVSARSLFHAFKRTRGYSPMVLVKQIRLQKAKQMFNTAARHIRDWRRLCMRVRQSRAFRQRLLSEVWRAPFRHAAVVQIAGSLRRVSSTATAMPLHDGAAAMT
jgi:AraC-like DNA-binding protein